MMQPHAFNSCNHDRCRAKHLRAAMHLMLALCLLASAAVQATEYEVEVNKSRRLLVVRAGEEVVEVFRAAVGRGGSGDKQQVGDKKTPVGTYRIVGSNDSDRFDHFFRLNYPNVKDAFYGLRNEIIDRAEFNRILEALRAGRLPPQNTRLGGAIGIHGVGEETPVKLRIHDNLDWTEGCIALRNAELNRLRRYLTVGTRVVIREQ